MLSQHNINPPKQQPYLLKKFAAGSSPGPPAERKQQDWIHLPAIPYFFSILTANVSIELKTGLTSV
ncbi:hypothetical protein RLOC_00006683 [Lonchura striata]|uniref:Uncharacterized protein n=1 Tax=Lonchura striata TaxID=40157 RepID=A0A218V1J6_9PASE|nr:hypothetical protein RLOC_00006683 [Lonchura striata domestica]